MSHASDMADCHDMKLSAAYCSPQNQNDHSRPFKAIRPGEILKDELDSRGWSQRDYAEITGKPLQTIHKILVGKKIITPETAVLFSKDLGTTAELWLNLETSCQLDRTRRNR
jgi:HTH-type transcriptional regulator / antitoxin HigA